jgi:hypothetical protein
MDMCEEDQGGGAAAKEREVSYACTPTTQRTDQETHQSKALG